MSVEVSALLLCYLETPAWVLRQVNDTTQQRHGCIMSDLGRDLKSVSNSPNDHVPHRRSVLQAHGMPQVAGSPQRTGSGEALAAPLPARGLQPAAMAVQHGLLRENNLFCLCLPH